MRVLIVKLSSMGDVIQALPAVTDACNALSSVQFDWVVDESFSEIPGWHGGVSSVVTSAHRRWRTKLFSGAISEVSTFTSALRSSQYHKVIDAQANLKSATVSLLARGEKHGLDTNSVREYGAHWAYSQTHTIDKSQLAIDRWRELFSKVLGYKKPTTEPDFGLSNIDFEVSEDLIPKREFFVFVHSASWQSKQWSIGHWRKLVGYGEDNDRAVLLPWGTEPERENAEAIAAGYSNAYVLPKLNLFSIAGILKKAEHVFSMDTGLAHLAAAVGAKTTTLYGATDPALIGATGPNSTHILATDFDCMPCYKRQCQFGNQLHTHAKCLAAITPENVWLSSGLG